MIVPDREGAAYRQLARILRERIERGELPAGGRLPSEKDLRDEFHLARETVRRAIVVLRDEGLVEVRHGYGTFVTAAPTSVRLRPGDFAISRAAIIVTRADGEREVYPGGTRLTGDDEQTT